jgi:hypothetical protein
MYKNELEVKGSILKDVLIQKDRDTLLVYMDAWKLQGFIKKEDIEELNELTSIFL